MLVHHWITFNGQIISCHRHNYFCQIRQQLEHFDYEKVQLHYYQTTKIIQVHCALNTNAWWCVCALLSHSTTTHWLAVPCTALSCWPMRRSEIVMLWYRRTAAVQVPELKWIINQSILVSCYRYMYNKIIMVLTDLHALYRVQHSFKYKYISYRYKQIITQSS